MRAPVCVAQPRERLSEPSVQRSTADGARPTDCGCRGLTGQVSCAGNSAARTTITDSIAEWVHSSISDSIAEFHLNVALGATSFFEILAKSGSLVRSCVLTSPPEQRDQCVCTEPAPLHRGHAAIVSMRRGDRQIAAWSHVRLSLGAANEGKPRSRGCVLLSRGKRTESDVGARNGPMPPLIQCFSNPHRKL
jgi:hypothetical protein